MLTVGEPPNDRGCRICKSSTHKEKTCPHKRTRMPNNKKILVKNGGTEQGRDAKTHSDIENSDSTSTIEDDLSLEQKTPEKGHDKHFLLSKPKSANEKELSPVTGARAERPFRAPPPDIKGLPPPVSKHFSPPAAKHLPPPGFSKQDAYTGITLYKSSAPNSNCQYVPQSPNNNSSSCIPSIVISNSKLKPEHPLHYPGNLSLPRPPPGFFPISHPQNDPHPRFNLPPPQYFGNDDPSDYLKALSMYHSPVLNPRPTVCPPFGNMHMAHVIRPPPDPRGWNPRPPPPQPLLRMPQLNVTVNSGPNVTEHDSPSDESNRNNNA